MIIRRFRRMQSAIGFLALPAFNAATPLLVLPALTNQLGHPGLATYGVALSVGSAASLIAELGWGIVGPQRIAGLGHRAQIALYQSALATKLISLALLVPPAVLASMMLAATLQGDAGLMTAGFALSCLSPAWFFIGLNSPSKILFLENIPKLALYGASAILVANGATLTVFGVATVAAPLVTLVLTAYATGQRILPGFKSFSMGFRDIGSHVPLAFGRGISAVYTSLPTALVALVSPQSVAVFTAADRLMRMTATMLIGFHNRFQSWVGTADGPLKWTRCRLQLVSSAVLGLASSIGFGFLAPAVAAAVFSGSVHISFTLSALASGVIFMLCITRGYGLCLVAIGKPNWISLANLCAALVGVGSILPLAQRLEAVGAFIAVILAELAGIVVQAIVFHLSYRNRIRSSHAGHDMATNRA